MSAITLKGIVDLIILSRRIVIHSRFEVELAEFFDEVKRKRASYRATRWKSVLTRSSKFTRLSTPIVRNQFYRIYLYALVRIHKFANLDPSNNSPLQSLCIEGIANTKVTRREYYMRPNCGYWLRTNGIMARRVPIIAIDHQTDSSISWTPELLCSFELATDSCDIERKRKNDRCYWWQNREHDDSARADRRFTLLFDGDAFSEIIHLDLYSDILQILHPPLTLPNSVSPALLTYL